MNERCYPTLDYQDTKCQQSPDDNWGLLKADLFKDKTALNGMTTRYPTTSKLSLKPGLTASTRLPISVLNRIAPRRSFEFKQDSFNGEKFNPDGLKGMKELFAILYLRIAPSTF